MSRHLFCLALLTLTACTASKVEPVDDTDGLPPAFVETADTADEIIPIPGEGAVINIISPADGDTVEQDFEVVWEVNGCDINYPSQDRGACHIHRIVDDSLAGPPLVENPGWYQYTAFQMTQLPPGQHTFTIELIPNGKPTEAEFDDRPHDPPIRDTVTITVLAPPIDTDVTDTDPAETDTAQPVDTAALDTVDDDGDGFSEAEGDCNDGNNAINPAATDLVGDTFDQNCDGVDGTDADGDGFASELSGGDDCDDSSDETYPGADDTPGDGIDQDCVDGDAQDTGGDSDDTGGDSDDTGGPSADTGADTDVADTADTGAGITEDTGPDTDPVDSATIDTSLSDTAE